MRTVVIVDMSDDQTVKMVVEEIVMDVWNRLETKTFIRGLIGDQVELAVIEGEIVYILMKEADKEKASMDLVESMLRQERIQRSKQRPESWLGSRNLDMADVTGLDLGKDDGRWIVGERILKT